MTCVWNDGLGIPQRPSVTEGLTTGDPTRGQAPPVRQARHVRAVHILANIQQAICYQRVSLLPCLRQGRAYHNQNCKIQNSMLLSSISHFHLPAHHGVSRPHAPSLTARRGLGRQRTATPLVRLEPQGPARISAARASGAQYGDGSEVRKCQDHFFRPSLRVSIYR